MKTLILVALAATLTGPAAATAAAQDTARTRTLFSKLPFRGAHIAIGAGTVPYLDHATDRGTAEIRIMLALRKYTDWSVGLSTSAVLDVDSTSYVAPGSVSATSAGFHPDLASVTNAFEVQRRWRQTRMLHGIAALSVGSITNSYNYYHRVNGRSTFREDEKRSVAFAQLAGGGELNIARWLRLNVLAGYRGGGRMTIPEARGSNGGWTMMASFAMGKF